jgi:hypothetical protein
MTSRIYWTSTEKSLVIAEALKLYQIGGMSPFTAIKVAQTNVLPKHRQRTLKTRSTVSRDIDALKTQYKASLRAAATASPIAAETTAQTETSVPAIAHTLASIDTMFEELIKALVARAITTIKSTIAYEVKELEHTFVVHKHNPTYDGARANKKRIVIVGLLNDQARHIMSEFGTTFDIRCFTVDAALHAEVPTADAYLLMRNFISHSVSAKYEKYSQHVLISGGMSALRLWLNTKGAAL